ncbi:MAG: hypothetical protein AAF529_00920 [Pseudomonadota bacterium]
MGCKNAPVTAATQASEPVSTSTPLGQAAALAMICSGCHQAGQDRSTGIGSLEGYSAAQLLSMLEAYRLNAEGQTAMHRLTRGYTQAQLAEIATYLSATKQAR